MLNKDVNDFLYEGIYGTKLNNPEERKQFLGELRERVILALTKGQVMQDKTLKELEKVMKEYKNTKLVLNGNMSYEALKQEKNLASKYNIPFVVVNNQSTSEIGVVLVSDAAVDVEDIYVTNNSAKKTETMAKSVNPFISFLRNWFK